MEVGFAISSLSMLFFDSNFDKMRFRSDKEPTVNIKFNTLDCIKNLLLTSNQRKATLSRKQITRMMKMNMCKKSRILVKKMMSKF